MSNSAMQELLDFALELPKRRPLSKDAIEAKRKKPVSRESAGVLNSLALALPRHEWEKALPVSQFPALQLLDKEGRGSSK